ncbi:hypothetical protein D3C87_1382770 [compost metagenome]
MDKAPGAADPELMAGIFSNAEKIIARETIFAAIGFKLLCFGIKLTNPATIGSYPDVFMAIFKNTVYGVVA